MKNKDKIIILKAKVIKLKKQLKAARLELADKDNEIKEYDPKSILETFLKDNFIQEHLGQYKDKEGVSLYDSIHKRESNPIESTKELFEGKWYVYYECGNEKFYAIGVTKKDQIFLFENDIKKAKIYNSFEEFEKEHEGMLGSHLEFLFEPIEKYKQIEPITPPLTPPTKENINYCHGG